MQCARCKCIYLVKLDFAVSLLGINLCILMAGQPNRNILYVIVGAEHVSFSVCRAYLHECVLNGG